MSSGPWPSLTAVHGMLRTDAIRLRRDRFLVAITVYLLGIAVVMRWLLPAITSDLRSEANFDLTPYHSLVVSYLIVQIAPLLPGIIGGFLLLESREDGTVKALLVSPNPLTSYITVTCIAMIVTAAVLTVVEGEIIALALPPWPALVAVALVAAPAAPIFALLLAAVSNNKVQAFAYMKLFGLGPVFVMGAYFIPEPVQWLAAIYPPYCASKAYWVAESGGPWPVWILAGLVTSTIWLGVLCRAYVNAARR